MATVGSTIPALKAALVERLALALPGVQVSYGIPAGEMEPDLVVVGEAIDESQEDAAYGQYRREETYGLRVIVSVVRDKLEDQQVVTERAFEIAREIETSLRDWGRVGNPFDGIVRTALVTGTDLEEPVSASEREGRVTLTVSCSERI